MCMVAISHLNRLKDQGDLYQCDIMGCWKGFNDKTKYDEHRAYDHAMGNS